MSVFDSIAHLFLPVAEIYIRTLYTRDWKNKLQDQQKHVRASYALSTIIAAFKLGSAVFRSAIKKDNANATSGACTATPSN